MQLRGGPQHPREYFLPSTRQNGEYWRAPKSQVEPQDSGGVAELRFSWVPLARGAGRQTPGCWDPGLPPKAAFEAQLQTRRDWATGEPRPWSTWREVLGQVLMTTEAEALSWRLGSWPEWRGLLHSLLRPPRRQGHQSETVT